VSHPVQDADAVPVHAQRLEPITQRSPFYVSREMVCFVAGIAVALGVLWLSREIGGKKRE
jgi:hypothetical protein